jgi:cysteine desulfurase
MDRIYLDHNASTPIDSRVLEVVTKALQEEGNPSSVHYHGQRAKQLIEQSRQTIAHFLKAKPSEIFFTSGGTEGAFLLIRGILQERFEGHVITSNAEHACVYKMLQEAEKKGCQVSFLPAGLWGAVSPEAVERAILPSTRLIVLMAVNNETGVKTDLEGVAKVAESAGIPLIVDGVALLGKENFVIPPGVSAMFFSGHKCHAPKGVGFVFCRNKLKLSSCLVGGGQEFNRRAGTENVAGIAGLAEAVRILRDHQDAFSKHMKEMRDRLEKGLKERLDGVSINGEGPRVVNTLNASFEDVDGESLLMSLDMEGLSVSHGSACSSGALEPSRILLNMGIPLLQARSAIRFSVSRFTTAQEIDRSLSILATLIQKLRAVKRKRLLSS